MNWIRLTGFALACWVAAIHSSGFDGVFLLDDIPTVQRGLEVARSFPMTITPRWIGDLTFGLNAMISGGKPADYHLVNILIHVAAALAFFGVVRRTVDRLLEGKADCGTASTVFAALCAMLWSGHPLTTQAVTYVCQRYESLASALMLVSLYAFIRAFGGIRSSRFWCNVSLSACLLGVGVKETAVAAPLLLMMYGRVFLPANGPEARRGRIAFFVAALASVPLMAVMQLHGMAGSYQTGNWRAVSPLIYLLTQGGVILHYVRLAFWPVGQCFDYAWPLAKPAAATIAPATVVIAIAACSFVAMWRRKPVGFLGAAFFLVLGTSSGVIPVMDLAFEHRMYLPLAPLTVAVTAGAWRVASIAGARAVRLALIAGLGIVLALAAMTVARNRLYASEEGMWRDVLAAAPHNLRARNDLAVVLAGQGRYKDAMTELRAAIDSIPAPVLRRLESGETKVFDSFANNSMEYAYFKTMFNMGVMAAGLGGDYGLAARCFTAALRVAPLHTATRVRLQHALQETGMDRSEAAREIKLLLKTGGPGLQQPSPR